MNLSVSSTTLREVSGGKILFPSVIREKICKGIGQISIADIAKLYSKHESDPDNFDSRIRQNLTKLLPRLVIHRNYPISTTTRFNCDICIESEDFLICAEIEKGYLARFEFDILKMQAFAGNYKTANPGKEIFGAFVVPSDNVVASHISGNSRESSFDYINRLFRLIAQIDSLSLKDILIVGYSASKQTNDVKVKNVTTSADNIVNSPAKEIIIDRLKGYPLQTAFKIRKILKGKFPNLKEKLNTKSKYLGYKNERSDALYIYLQKNQLVIDVRVSKDEAENLRKEGFVINPRENFQSVRGWLTGICIPHEKKNIQAVIDLACLALKND